MPHRPSEYFKDEQGDLWLLFGTVEDTEGERVMLVPVKPVVRMEIASQKRTVRSRDGLEKLNEITVTQVLP